MRVGEAVRDRASFHWTAISIHAILKLKIATGVFGKEGMDMRHWHGKNQSGKRRWAALLALVMALSLMAPLSGCGKGGQEQGPDVDQPADSDGAVAALTRLLLLDFSGIQDSDVTPSVPAYQVSQDLSNVVNQGQFHLSDSQRSMLAKNMFVVSSSYYNEFFEQYETNRYDQIPNFITVDSMMHTYHLYFSLLLNRTEKNYLAADLAELSGAMLEAAEAQYEALKGTDWEEAARRSVAFFAVGARLQNESIAVPDYAADLAETELQRIYAAQGIDVSPLAEDNMDYTQYIPRGYYEGDQVLEAYFRAMMWYGQVNFVQKNDDLTRAALLITLTLMDSSKAWENLYAVTSFFAGSSDDLGYYDYAPAVVAAYGQVPAASQLTAEEENYQTFKSLVEKMDPPAINSVPVWDDPNDPSEVGDVLESKKGFRFMGQRFTIDAAIMQQLVYRAVEEADDGDKRLLPDALDVPAALGSEAALNILKDQGVTKYPNYMEQMETLRDQVEKAPVSTWTSSLYSSWLYTLTPVLEAKGEGWPSYMTSEEWQKKDLETFAGSYTELKHDTVLYAKQVMAEMGGGPQDVVDDRGYVDPEADVYERFALLAQQTADGLDKLGYLGDNDRENLSRLAELAQQLVTISEKELQNETLTDVEYELIRGYGGTLEHFWTEAVKDRADTDYLDTQEIPSSLVTDIATDPNGAVLQVATGRPAEILVVVPVDGTLRIASGVVYDFYQFTQPISQRLTDTQWRQMIGQWASDDGSYNWDAKVEKPQWTQSYWSEG